MSDIFLKQPFPRKETVSKDSKLFAAAVKDVIKAADSLDKVDSILLPLFRHYVAYVSENKKALRGDTLEFLVEMSYRHEKAKSKV